MEKYHLFAFDDYYPSGGAKDYVESFDSVEEAVSFATNHLTNDIYQITTSTMEIVEQGYIDESLWKKF